MTEIETIPAGTPVGSVNGDDWTCPCGAEGNGGLEALGRHASVLHGPRQLVPFKRPDTGPVVPEGVDSKVVRAWARENGWPLLGDRGRMPQPAIDAYLAAHS